VVFVASRVSESVPRSALADRARTTPEDFAEFVARYRERGLRIAFRLLAGDDAAAQDALQNAFLRAFRGLPSFRGESSLDTWFYRILLREISRQRRWQSLRRLWSGDPETAPEPVDPRPRPDPALRRRIAAALEKLTHAQREVFVLVHLEGLSISEAAGVLGKASGTLKSHLHRALASLRESLADLRSES
jgi:RNA polymerase sigma-70 factor (ECF subfamily)